MEQNNAAAVEPMTLTERLRNPQWERGTRESEARLNIAQTRATMDEAAGRIDAFENLLSAARKVIAQRDRPHGFPDNDWYEPAFDDLRAALTNTGA